MGEAILILPMIKRLKKKYPDSKITILVRKRTVEVFENQPFIDEIIIFSPLKLFKLIKKFDLCIDSEPHFNISAILSFFLSKQSIGFSHGKRAKLYDIQIDYNDQQHSVLTFCDMISPFGISFKPSKLEPVHYSKENKELIDSKLKGLKKKTLIGIHLGSGDKATWRRWPKERFISLIKRLISNKKIEIILTGTKSESEINQEIISSTNPDQVFDFSGMSLGELSYLMENFDLFLSNDTGPMHVAAAQDVKTAGLFGPNLPVRFGPYPTEKNIIFYHKVECSPCINVHKGEFRDCPYDGKCMKLITVDEVYKKLVNVLENK